MNGVLGAYINVFICFALPVGALVWLLIFRRWLVLPFLLGTLCFVASQVLLRIPLLSFLSQQGWYQSFASGAPILFVILVGGLSAGIFEEGARWLVMRYVLASNNGIVLSMSRWQNKEGKRYTSNISAVAFGIGHGGFEAAWLVGVQWLWLLMYSGTPLMFLPFGDALASGVERLIAMAAHVMFSLLVMKSVRERKRFWLIAAVILHTVINSVGVLTMTYTGSVWLTQGVLAACVFAMFMIVVTVVPCET